MSSSAYLDAPSSAYAAPALPLPGAADADWVEPAVWQALLGGARLEPGELAALQAMARLRRLPAGARVFGRGEPALVLVAVLEGSVGLGLARDEAAAPFHLERTLRGPAWVDLGSAWLGGGHGQDARALGPAQLAELPLGAMRLLMARQPAMQDRLLVALAQTVRALSAAAHDLMHKDAEKRLVAWLLQQAGGQSQLRLAERKRDIAAQLAITPETLSRMMRQLKTKGLIAVAGYTVQLLDPAGLLALAGTE
ncbi:Crp/Fnr family transcriptional regulator [Roseateles sp. DAIF2]|uniref:Crp/Fnr family transcriptional regulator n=1 Tax=Roseateles sp. DAIF2 TaxID=2714952 RepID=UPI0018A31CFC|nr:Crp/Fnr family transcriptional regulator [Roseateles sp. DAIF2]QPF72789.1 Crp/Fnr family transcriptional regulator [Roseateles sp. DAIF2]